MRTATSADNCWEGLRAADEHERFLAELVEAFGVPKSAELRLADWRHNFVQAVLAAKGLQIIKVLLHVPRLVGVVCASRTRSVPTSP
jgi:hypothetical protein